MSNLETAACTYWWLQNTSSCSHTISSLLAFSRSRCSSLSLSLSLSLLQRSAVIDRHMSATPKCLSGPGVSAHLYQSMHRYIQLPWLITPPQSAWNVWAASVAPLPLHRPPRNSSPLRSTNFVAPKLKETIERRPLDSGSGKNGLGWVMDVSTAAPAEGRWSALTREPSGPILTDGDGAANIGRRLTASVVISVA